MEAKGFKLRTWARAKGLSDTDFMILYQLNLGAMLGRWGRGAKLRKLLEAEGFDTSFLDSCNSKDCGSLGSGDCFGDKSPRNDEIKDCGNSLDCFGDKSPRNDNMVVVG